MILSMTSLTSLIDKYGYFTVCFSVIIECIGVPFPGETAVIISSLYAAKTGHLSIDFIFLSATVGAILGDNIGYSLGKNFGLRLILFLKKWLKFDESVLEVGEYAFFRLGGFVVLFGRFFSILRTWISFLAGTNEMQRTKFIIFNAIGGILWAALYSFGTFLIGQRIFSLKVPFEIAGISIFIVAFISITIYTKVNYKKLRILAHNYMKNKS